MNVSRLTLGESPALTAAKQDFLQRVLLSLIPVALTIFLVQTWLHEDSRLSALLVSCAIVMVLMVSGWAAKKLPPLATGVTLSTVLAVLILSAASLSGVSTTFGHFVAPVLILTTMVGTRVAMGFLAAIFVAMAGATVLSPAFASREAISTTFSMGAIQFVVFVVAAAMARLWHAAHEARLESERKSLLAPQKALSIAFPATALLDGEILREPTSAFQTLFGPKAVEGIHFNVLWPEEERHVVREALQKFEHIELRVGDRVVELFATPVPEVDIDESPRELRVIAARDVTLRARLADQLATTQRVVALSELAAGVAHEIQNPLTSLMLCVGFLEDGTAPEPDDVSEIQRAAERIRQTVNDLIALTNSHGEPPIATVVTEPISTALRIAEASIRASDAEITVEHENPNVMMTAPPTRTSQALAHLLVNAVNAQGDRYRPKVLISTRVSEGYVEIRVSDNGLGIAQDVLPRIFDPFVSTREVGDGAGLGLSLAHNVVTSAGGTLEVENTGATGTTMLIRLLLDASADTPLLEESSQGSTRPPAANTRALVASDEPAIAEGIGRILGEYIQVVVALSGPEALTALETDHFDLVICDLTMRNVAGTELLATLPKGAVGVALTGGAFSPRVQRFLETWDGDVLSKPIRPKHLLRVLRRITKHRPEISDALPVGLDDDSMPDAVLPELD